MRRGEGGEGRGKRGDVPFNFIPLSRSPRVWSRRQTTASAVGVVDVVLQFGVGVVCGEGAAGVGAFFVKRCILWCVAGEPPSISNVIRVVGC